MSAKAAEASPGTAAPKSKGKLMLLVGVLGALVLAAAAAGGTWYFMNRGAAGSHGEAAAPAEAKPVASTYYALENLIVNLSDAGGERVAQIGIVLDVDGEKTVNDIKAVLPVVRNRVLLLASQRTAEELLKRDGKEKLAIDIAAEVSRALGLDVPAPVAKAAKGEAAADEAPPPRKAKAAGPIRGVLFSSFIVQ